MSRRIDRVNGLLRQELAYLLAHELRDPRLPLLVSITRVETSSDLATARVFVSVAASQEEREVAFHMLQSAARFLRRELASRVALRHIPFLQFQMDDSIREGTRILSLMDGLQSSEESG